MYRHPVSKKNFKYHPQTRKNTTVLILLNYYYIGYLYNNVGQIPLTGSLIAVYKTTTHTDYNEIRYLLGRKF